MVKLGIFIEVFLPCSMMVFDELEGTPSSRSEQRQNRAPCESSVGFGSGFEVQTLDEIETVEVHHLCPGCDEVVDEFFLVIVGSVDLGDGSEL